MTHKYSKLTVKASQVKRAMDGVKDTFDDCQAQYLEVLLLPKVYRRWREANRDHHNPETLTVERVAGMPHKGYAPDDNRAVGDAKGWSKFAGYLLYYHRNPDTGDTYGWNRVGTDGYSHSPSRCWDGISRETIHQFVYFIGASVAAWSRGESLNHEASDVIERYGIVLVNDLGVNP